MLVSNKYRNSSRLETLKPVSAAVPRRGAEAGRFAGWIGWLLGCARYAPRPDQAEDAGMNLCLELQLELAPAVWLKASGTSMLPWRIPGCEVKLEPAGPDPEVGLIVVFRRGPRLYYHRVIERMTDKLWRTKGDTLIEPDEPVSQLDIVGCVTAVRRGNRLRTIRPDPGAAWLSARVGRCFGRLGQPVGKFRRVGLRAAYLAILLSVWPFRGLLVRHPCQPGASSTALRMEKD